MSKKYIPERQIQYLEEIYDFCNKIKKYTENLSYDEFERDDKTVDAVCRNLELIGEAAKRIHRKIKDKYPEQNWNDISGLRDELAHDYSSIDMKVVWKIVQEDIDRLKSYVSYILEKEFGISK